jgi:hypothetical protein
VRRVRLGIPGDHDEARHLKQAIHLVEQFGIRVNGDNRRTISNLGQSPLDDGDDLNLLNRYGLALAKPVDELLAENLADLRVSIELGILVADQPGFPAPGSLGFLDQGVIPIPTPCGLASAST